MYETLSINDTNTLYFLLNDLYFSCHLYHFECLPLIHVRIALFLDYHVLGMVPIGFTVSWRVVLSFQCTTFVNDIKTPTPVIVCFSYNCHSSQSSVSSRTHSHVGLL